MKFFRQVGPAVLTWKALRTFLRYNRDRFFFFYIKLFFLLHVYKSIDSQLYWIDLLKSFTPMFFLCLHMHSVVLKPVQYGVYDFKWQRQSNWLWYTWVQSCLRSFLTGQFNIAGCFKYIYIYLFFYVYQKHNSITLFRAYVAWNNNYNECSSLKFKHKMRTNESVISFTLFYNIYLSLFAFLGDTNCLVTWVLCNTCLVHLVPSYVPMLNS